MASISFRKKIITATRVPKCTQISKNSSGSLSPKRCWKITKCPELLIGKNMSQESTVEALETAGQRLKQSNVFDVESLEALLRPLAEELELKTGQLFGTLRTAVTGRTATPPLFQTMEVLLPRQVAAPLLLVTPRLKLREEVELVI